MSLFWHMEIKLSRENISGVPQNERTPPKVRVTKGKFISGVRANYAIEKLIKRASYFHSKPYIPVPG